MENCQYDAREMWELHEALVKAGMKLITYLRIVDLVKDAVALELREVVRYSDTNVSTVRRALPVLRQFDEVFRSHHDGKTWLLTASEEEFRLCRKRKISLYNWVRLRPLMRELREDIMRYYQRALYQQWEVPVETMGELKERWMLRLAPIVYPSVLEKEWSYMKPNVMRYVRTCQDLVLNDICVPREYAERVMRGEITPDIEILELCDIEEEEDNGKPNGEDSVQVSADR